VNSFAYDDPPSMSTGARFGHWLDVPPPGPPGDA
jgi:hypothetical protein